MLSSVIGRCENGDRRLARPTTSDAAEPPGQQKQSTRNSMLRRAIPFGFGCVNDA